MKTESNEKATDNLTLFPFLAASSSSLHSSATSFSASTSDLLAGSLINLAALQQRVPENTKKN